MRQNYTYIFSWITSLRLAISINFAFAGSRQISLILLYICHKTKLTTTKTTYSKMACTWYCRH